MADEPKFAPLCIWCSAPWSDDNISAETFASEGCDSCGYGEVERATITIRCHECGKIMYKKETESYPWGGG